MAVNEAISSSSQFSTVSVILFFSCSFFLNLLPIDSSSILFLGWRSPSINMQFRSGSCNRALMRVRNRPNSVKRNDEKNTVNSSAGVSGSFNAFLIRSR